MQTQETVRRTFGEEILTLMHNKLSRTRGLPLGIASNGGVKTSIGLVYLSNSQTMFSVIIQGRGEDSSGQTAISVKRLVVLQPN